MAFKQGGKTRIGIGVLVLFGLALGGNQISDLSPLSGLINLGELNLCANRISDLSPLSGLSTLRSVDLRYNPLSVVSANIYVPLLRLRGVDVRMTSPPVLLIIIIGTALVLIAIRMRSMADWGLAHRVLQLSLITIAGGLAYYLAATTEPGPPLASPRQRSLIHACLQR